MNAVLRRIGLAVAVLSLLISGSGRAEGGQVLKYQFSGVVVDGTSPLYTGGEVVSGTFSYDLGAPANDPVASPRVYQDAGGPASFLSTTLSIGGFDFYGPTSLNRATVYDNHLGSIDRFLIESQGSRYGNGDSSSSRTLYSMSITLGYGSTAFDSYALPNPLPLTGFNVREVMFAISDGGARGIVVARIATLERIQPDVAAVPEPSTLAGGLLGVVLMGGAWLRQRRRQAA